MKDPSESSNDASNQHPACVVMKFGGTSVEDAAAIKRLCRLVERSWPDRPVVVVSALARVTDQLTERRMGSGGRPVGFRAGNFSAASPPA